MKIEENQEHKQKEKEKINEMPKIIKAPRKLDIE